VENPPSDIDLALLARGGDREAFAAIVSRHGGRLVNLFRRLGADVHGAEDCAQETFLRLYRSLDRYSPRAPFAAFLYTIARHAWVDWTRRSRRRETEPVEAIEAKEGPATGIKVDDRLDLRAAVAALPDHLRLVVVLGIDEGLRYEEIGAVLGIPVGTVKSRMFHAVRALREALHAEAER
jgi:RNA polymerase sigma-70 factor (ECF subfamily)